MKQLPKVEGKLLYGATLNIQSFNKMELLLDIRKPNILEGEKCVSPGM